MINFVVAGGAIITIATIGLSMAHLGSRYQGRQRREAQRSKKKDETQKWKSFVIDNVRMALCSIDQMLRLSVVDRFRLEYRAQFSR